MRNRRPIAAFLTAILLSTTALVGASRAEEGAPSPWSFEIAPYVWLPEVGGKIGARGVNADVDVTFGDIFDLLGDGKMFAAGGHFEAKYDRFSLFVDAWGGTARPSDSGVTVGQRVQRTGSYDLTLNYSFVEFGGAYRVLQWPLNGPGRPIRIDLLAGGRFMYFYQSITLQGDRGKPSRYANATSTWVDPFVGGRFAVPVWDEIDVVFRGDIGGFGAGSQLAWNVIGGFEYRLPWEPGGAQTSLAAVYKAFDFDYQASGRDQVIAALDFRGPALGLVFQF
jgi:hypothetical protein